MSSPLMTDLRGAFRGLRRSPLATAVAVLSLALAIAGNATLFSVVHALFYRPLPYVAAEDIVFVTERGRSDAQAAGKLATVQPANYLDLVQRQRSLAQTAAFWGAALSLDTGAETPEPVVGATVTPGFFPLLGTRFRAGRPFEALEGQTGGPPVVILSHRFWLEHGGDEAHPERMLGQPLRFNGTSYEVVGVLEEDFEFVLAPSIQVWLPMILEATTAPREGRGIFALGRLAQGASSEIAADELSAIMEDLEREHPEANGGRLVEILSLRQDVPDTGNRRLLFLGQGALAAVLLIACVNLANLLLARGRQRRPEAVLRRALGASRWRVARLPIVESLLLTLAGGLMGTILSYFAIQALALRIGPLLPNFWAPAFEPAVLLFGWVLALAAGVTFGLLPALSAGSGELATVLRDGGRGGRSSRRLGAHFLVVGQIALATMLLAGTGMMVRGAQRIQGADAGFDTKALVMMNVQLPAQAFPTTASRAAAMNTLTERLAALPGAASATAANVPPRGPVVPAAQVTMAGEAPAPESPTTEWLVVHRDFFDALELETLFGRTFLEGDDDGRPVAVVDQAFARRHFGGEDRGKGEQRAENVGAVGRRLVIHGEERDIIGVVADARHDLGAVIEARPTVYLLWAQTLGFQGAGSTQGVDGETSAEGPPPIPLFRALVRAESPAAADTLLDPARREILAWNRDVAVSGVTTLDAYTAQFATGHRLFAALFGAFGALALLLAALGVYGVTSYSVTQRRHEMGIRAALGAPRRDLTLRILRQSGVLALAGLALGVPGTLAVSRLLTGVLGSTVTLGAESTAMAVALLALAVILAGYPPARRAATVDPAESLRQS